MKKEGGGVQRTLDRIVVALPFDGDDALKKSVTERVFTTRFFNACDWGCRNSGTVQYVG